jgi:hypothetical protein
LKEFSDFETYETPAFRHPPVMGSKEELNSIGLLKELEGLNMFYDPAESDNNKIQDQIHQEIINYDTMVKNRYQTLVKK